MEPLNKEASIKNLIEQRAELVVLLERGEKLAQVSIDFIDSFLSQVVPGYKAPVHDAIG